MAITVLTQPQLFTTLNLALFKITSDRPTIVSFKVEVIDAATATVMIVQKYTTLPQINNGTSFNLSPLLSSFIGNEIDVSIDFLKPTPKIYKSYKIRITEIYLVGSVQTNGAVFTSDIFNIFNATLSRTDFSSFDYKKYIANNDDIKSVFLSKRPTISNLYYSSVEYLYFMANVSGKARLTFYKKGGIEVGSHDVVFDATVHKAFRLNLTPISMSEYFGDDILNNYGGEFETMFDLPFGVGYGINDANYFTIELFSNDGVSISEKRTYSLISDKCRTTLLEFLFSNNLGGIDSMVFVEPRQTVNSSKTIIDSNPFQYDAVGNYNDKINGIFYPDKKIISSKNTSSFSANSEPLSDSNSMFARNLIESDYTLIKLKSGDLFPVVIDSQEYSINRTKHNTNNYRLTLNFKVDDTNFSL